MYQVVVKKNYRGKFLSIIEIFQDLQIICGESQLLDTRCYGSMLMSSSLRYSKMKYVGVVKTNFGARSLAGDGASLNHGIREFVMEESKKTVTEENTKAIEEEIS